MALLRAKPLHRIPGVSPRFLGPPRSLRIEALSEFVIRRVGVCLRVPLCYFNAFGKLK